MAATHKTKEKSLESVNRTLSLSHKLEYRKFYMLCFQQLIFNHVDSVQYSDWEAAYLVRTALFTKFINTL